MGKTKMTEAQTQPEEKLPQYIVLNPAKAGMFYDPELSGVYLNQFGGVDADGNELKAWCRVPTDTDCTRIKEALRQNLVFPCNPRGESKYVKVVESKSKNMDEFMAKNTRELIVIVDQTQDVNMLQKMVDWEVARPQKERRTILIQSIRARIASPDVVGVTGIATERATIIDKETNKEVPDDIAIK